jgi:hypothetical protein
MNPSVELNTTFHHTIPEVAFGTMPMNILVDLFQDGRIFSHFIERWLPMYYPLIHTTGCKSYDHVDANNNDILYEQKTFTKGGCNFCPSNMLGQGRVFDKTVFEEKAKKLIYIIVSNVNFPEIKIKFVRGEELVTQYPNGKITLKDIHKFFD